MRAEEEDAEAFVPAVDTASELLSAGRARLRLAAAVAALVAAVAAADEVPATAAAPDLDAADVEATGAAAAPFFCGFLSGISGFVSVATSTRIVRPSSSVPSSFSAHRRASSANALQEHKVVRLE